MAKTNRQAATTFMSIVNGFFVERCEPNEPGAVKRFSEKLNRDVWEHKYTDISGVISDISFKTNEYGTYLVLTLDDGPENITLNIPMSDFSYCNGVLYRLPNIDFSLPVNLGVSIKEDKKSLFVSQTKADGTRDNIKYYYTKEHKNGLPDAVKKTVFGKEKWDFEEQNNFFFDLVNTTIKEKIAKAQGSTQTPQADKPKDAVVDDEEDDQLPF